MRTALWLKPLILIIASLLEERPLICKLYTDHEGCGNRWNPRMTRSSMHFGTAGHVECHAGDVVRAAQVHDRVPDVIRGLRPAQERVALHVRVESRLAIDPQRGSDHRIE